MLNIMTLILLNIVESKYTKTGNINEHIKISKYNNKIHISKHNNQ